MGKANFAVKCLFGLVLILMVINIAIRITTKPTAYPLVTNLFYDAEKVAPNTYKRLKAHKGVKRVGIVSVSSSFLKGRKEWRVTCEVSPGTTFTSVLKRSDTYTDFPTDTEFWYGDIEGLEYGNVSLTIDHERHIVIGEIRTLTRLYEIRSISKADENVALVHGLHALLEWDLTEETGVDKCGVSPDLLKNKVDATEVIVPAGKGDE